ncbi:MAG: TRAP transporter small permease [Pseudomonadota bacterium]|nr:TRAP transporter small permease [Pseudomonadota bacterium]
MSARPDSPLPEHPQPSPELHDSSVADDATRVPLALEDWATVAIMALLACITFANVLVRYFTNQSFAWTEEISVFLMILLAMVAGSAAVARGRHIRIDYFAERGSAARRRGFSRLGAAAVALMFALMAVLSARVLWDDIRFEETSPGLGVPQWWYTVWLPAISLAITLRAVGLFIRLGRARDDEEGQP